MNRHTYNPRRKDGKCKWVGRYSICGEAADHPSHYTEDEAMTPTPAPQDITVDYSSDYYTDGWFVRRGNVELASCMDEQDAKDYAALLRFRDAMLEAEPEDGLYMLHVAALAMSGTSTAAGKPQWARIAAALDTLRAALTKEG